MNQTVNGIIEFIQKQAEKFSIADYVDLLERLQEEIELLLAAARHDLES